MELDEPWNLLFAAMAPGGPEVEHKTAHARDPAAVPHDCGQASRNMNGGYLSSRLEAAASQIGKAVKIKKENSESSKDYSVSLF
jgi:hypothetical protein